MKRIPIILLLVLFSIFALTACFAVQKPQSYEQPRPGETLLKKMETDCGGKHYTLYLYWYEPYGRIRVEALIDKKHFQNFPNRFYGFQKEKLADIRISVEQSGDTAYVCMKGTNSLAVSNNNPLTTQTLQMDKAYDQIEKFYMERWDHKFPNFQIKLNTFTTSATTPPHVFTKTLIASISNAAPKHGGMFQFIGFGNMFLGDEGFLSNSDDGICKAYAREGLTYSTQEERKRIASEIGKSTIGGHVFEKIISSSAEIDGYATNPLPKDKEMLIAPLSMRVDDLGNEQWSFCAHNFAGIVDGVERGLFRYTIEFDSSKRLTGKMTKEVLGTKIGKEILMMD